jgi:hypothetical protein
MPLIGIAIGRVVGLWFEKPETPYVRFQNGALLKTHKADDYL